MSLYVYCSLTIFMLEDLNLKEITVPTIRLIMVIGAPDTGKTNLVWSMASRLKLSYKTAIVDLDMGQSHIGPPTMIAWAIVQKDAQDWGDLKARDFYFTGAVSPVGSLLPSIIGARLMTEKAFAVAEKILIDTTGLISEPSGRVLKQFKIDLLRPDLIIAIESTGELSHIIDTFRYCKRPKIIRLAVSSAVKIKSPIKRSQYRFERMKDYLKDGGVLEIERDKVGIRFTGSIGLKEGIINRVISLRDEFNMDIGLGVIKGMTERVFKIYTPLKDGDNISNIVIGRTVFDTKEKTLRDY